MISNGTKIGRYEVRSLIGAGGMGEVYLARDPRIGRDVAIKVLPTDLASDKERLARFEQEAQAAGSLNHPNILAIYDVEAHNGSPYVVSELLDGHTLRTRLDECDVTQRNAIDYAVQIANGLAAAHEKGIVHRDLKPENLFITNDERVKILDFGLAKLLQKDDGPEALSDAPTRKVNTDAGTVMGTVGYMSPEQVRGGKIDHRTDLFSFGTILYEMLSGKPAFRGETGVETLNAILKEDPPELADVSGRTVSPALESIVRHCLEKKPDRRFQSANDVAFALQAFSRGSGSAATVIAPNVTAPPDRERIFWITACAILLLAAIGALAYTFLRSSAPTQQLRLTLKAPQSVSAAASIAISPDGQRVVFRAIDNEGHMNLWLRPLNSLEARKLEGTDVAVDPFWSPDSRRLGYFSLGKLYTLDTEGGRPQAICDAVNAGGGAWNRDNVIIMGGNEGVYRVNATGGKPVLVTKVNEKEEAHRWPSFLPDGKHFVFLGDAPRAEDHNIRMGSLDSEETKSLFQAISRIEYAAPGYLLFVRQNTLEAQKFDASTGTIVGDPLPVTDQIVDLGPNHEFDFSVSDDGLLVYQMGSRDSNLIWVDRTGKELERFSDAADFRQISLFPDGHRVVTSVADADGRNGDLWLIDFARGGSKQRLTFDPLDETQPVISPDGTRIAYTSGRKTGEYRSLYLLNVDSGQDEELLTEPQIDHSDVNWSPDGRFLLFTSCASANDTCSLNTLSMDGSHEVRQYLSRTPYLQYNSQISPDGKWAAYVSEESGRPEVYVQSFPQPGRKRQISTYGGFLPFWRHDNHEIFFKSLDGKLMSVAVRPGITFDSDPPTELFAVKTKSTDGRPFAVSSDGQKFLVNARADQPGGPNFVVVQNWDANLGH